MILTNPKIQGEELVYRPSTDTEEPALVVMYKEQNSDTYWKKRFWSSQYNYCNIPKEIQQDIRVIN